MMLLFVMLNFTSSATAAPVSPAPAEPEELEEAVAV